MALRDSLTRAGQVQPYLVPRQFEGVRGGLQNAVMRLRLGCAAELLGCNQRQPKPARPAEAQKNRPRTSCPITATPHRRMRARCHPDPWTLRGSPVIRAVCEMDCNQSIPCWIDLGIGAHTVLWGASALVLRRAKIGANAHAQGAHDRLRRQNTPILQESRRACPHEYGRVRLFWGAGMGVEGYLARARGWRRTRNTTGCVPMACVFSRLRGGGAAGHRVPTNGGTEACHVEGFR